MKIVSLLPSATEIVFALGLGDHLEGVTYECDFPDAARSKPVVVEGVLPQDRPLTARAIDDAVRDHMDARQPIYTLHKELIQKIQPDLILAQDLCRVCAVPSGQVEDALAELGTEAEVLSLDPQDLEGILGCITRVGRATGAEAPAAELVGKLRKRIEALTATATRLPAIRALSLEWSDPPYAGGHWVPEMVARVGGQNLLNEPKARSRTVTWREVGDAQPEVIVFMPCGYYLEEAEEEGARLFDVPELQMTTAVSSGAVYAVDATSYFSRPGPRIVDGMDILAWAIHPEAFPAPPPGRVTRLGPG